MESDFAFDMDALSGISEMPMDFGIDWQAFTDPGLISAADPFGTTGMLYDTVTGQYVNWDQAFLLDPEAAQSAYTQFPPTSQPTGGGGATSSPTGQTGGNGGGSAGPGGAGGGVTPGQQGSGGLDWNALAKVLSGALSVGAAGLGAAGIAEGVSGRRPGASSTTNTMQDQNRLTSDMINRNDLQNTTQTVTPGPLGVEAQYLLNQIGGPEYQGLQGMAGHGIFQNMNPQNGLMNQQAHVLGRAATEAPMPDAGLNQQLLSNAQGMAAGNLPALTPQLQHQINTIYGSQWNHINRYLEDYLTNVRDQMNNMGWEGSQYDVLRQGPGQALFAPALREATRQQGLLAGQAAQAGINLAQQLPMNALQLGTGVYNQNLAGSQNLQNIASAFNQPIGARNQVGLGLFNSLNQAPRGSTTRTNQQGVQNTASNQNVVGNLNQNVGQQGTMPPMSWMDAFDQASKILGAIGGAAGGMNRLGG